MDKSTQIRFVNQLIENVKIDILKDFENKIPDEWDGFELRQYVADKYSDIVMDNMMSKRRRKAYKNTTLYI